MNLELKKILDERKDLQKFLFIKGFLITSKDLKNIKDNFPFYSNFELKEINGFNFWIYKNVPFNIFEKKGKTYFGIGHAYNPFTMEFDEKNILKYLAEKNEKGESAFIDGVNELTGIFLLGYTENKNIRVLLDASGMQYGCYGKVGNDIFVSSYIQLVNDILNLDTLDYVKELINYRWYHYMKGNYLPGDLTPFKEFKRIIPNTLVDYKDGNFAIKRFYPEKPLEYVKNDDSYKKVIEEASEIMKKNMQLILKKWNRPAISLTGGLDSQTTLAAANGLYDKYATFSYISMYRESVDAEVAKKRAEKFNLKHSIYKVPDNNNEIEDFDILKRILQHNEGDIGSNKDNDIRKKIYLMNNFEYDVEVKNWIGETFRGNAYKYFGRTKMPKSLKPRHYTSLYKIFFLNRKLVYETDKYFKEYIEKTNLKEKLFNYDESDFFVWEMIDGGKNGLNIGVMKFCFDITIPYNNRKFLDILLRTNIQDRISDKVHLDMTKYLNKELYDMNLRVINLNETKFRKFLANVYFTINSSIPF
uniref:Asparagine synthetase domain-containing protein n=1 Tax=candidate division WOR-3 bacterium TaxID=2052148 RepID=A0A7C3N567_UNCW3